MIRRSIDHPERPETEERVRAFLFTYSRLRRAPGKLAAHEGEGWAQDTLLMCTDLRGDIPDALVESTAATVAIDSVRKTLAVLERTVPDLSLGTGWTESDSNVGGVGSVWRSVCPPPSRRSRLCQCQWQPTCQPWGLRTTPCHERYVKAVERRQGVRTIRTTTPLSSCAVPSRRGILRVLLDPGLRSWHSRCPRYRLTLPFREAGSCWSLTQARGATWCFSWAEAATARAGTRSWRGATRCGLAREVMLPARRRCHCGVIAGQSHRGRGRARGRPQAGTGDGEERAWSLPRWSGAAHNVMPWGGGGDLDAAAAAQSGGAAPPCVRAPLSLCAARAPQETQGYDVAIETMWLRGGAHS